MLTKEITTSIRLQNANSKIVLISRKVPKSSVCLLKSFMVPPSTVSSLNHPQSTTSERFFVKQPQISYGVRAGYFGRVFNYQGGTYLIGLLEEDKILLILLGQRRGNYGRFFFRLIQ